jgi:hypothetical protein
MNPETQKRIELSGAADPAKVIAAYAETVGMDDQTHIQLLALAVGMCELATTDLQHRNCILALCCSICNAIDPSVIFPLYMLPSGQILSAYRKKAESVVESVSVATGFINYSKDS